MMPLLLLFKGNVNMNEKWFLNAFPKEMIDCQRNTPV